MKFINSVAYVVGKMKFKIIKAMKLFVILSPLNFNILKMKVELL